MATVFFRGLEFYAFHGVTAEEQATGRRYRMTVSMEVDFDGTDEVGATVDYGAAAVLAVEVATRDSRKLVETVATEVGSALLARYSRASAVTVELEKLHPPAPLVLDSAGVIVRLAREASRT